VLNERKYLHEQENPYGYHPDLDPNPCRDCRADRCQKESEEIENFVRIKKVANGAVRMFHLQLLSKDCHDTHRT